MLCYNTKILMLGLNYTNCTACHFGEFTLEVPYRGTIEKLCSVRQPDGSVVEGVEMTDYQPSPSADGSYYGDRTPDFNRIGQDLEQKGLVRVFPPPLLPPWSKPSDTAAAHLPLPSPRAW